MNDEASDETDGSPRESGISLGSKGAIFMKLPISWLKEWVPIRANAEEIGKRLTFAGFEVEGTETIGDETVFEVNVTPNRGDALSVRGLAREIGALFGVAWKAPYA